MPNVILVITNVTFVFKSKTAAVHRLALGRKGKWSKTFNKAQVE